MAENCCPHCGAKVPVARDAFCGTCGESLDEPPPEPRTPEQQRAFRAEVERNALKSTISLAMLLRFLRFFRGI
jgi:predicted amidophosphoribosyltransferase